MDTQQRGASLVEVMVALFVLAIGLLGILAMQTRAMQFNQSAHVYSQAVYLANDMAERIRSNPNLIENYVLAATNEPPDATNCDEVACNTGQLVVWDQSRWVARIVASLPGGQGQIERVGTENAVIIRVSFDDSRAEPADAQGAPRQVTQTYSVRVGV